MSKIARKKLNENLNEIQPFSGAKILEKER